METDTVTRIRENAAAIKQIALAIDASNTESVTVADLKPGDIITTLGAVAFPFPFTISAVKNLGRHGVILNATHGWTTMRPAAATDTATRVL